MTQENKTKEFETQGEWFTRVMNLVLSIFATIVGALGIITSLIALTKHDWVNCVFAVLIGIVFLTAGVFGMKRNIR